jgi:simple sugar transport system permease protein
LKRKPTKRVTAIILLFALAGVTIAMGAAGFGMRAGEYATATLGQMRSWSVLRVAANGIIDEITLAARREARAFAEEEGMTRNERTAYVEQVGAETAASAEAQYGQFGDFDTAALEARVDEMIAAQRTYETLLAKERADYAAEYIRTHGAQAVEEEPDEALEPEAAVIEGDAAADDSFDDSAIDADEDEEIKVDYAQFEPSAQLSALKPEIEAAFDGVWAQLQALMPELRDEMREDTMERMLPVTYAHGEDFEARYDRFAALGAESNFDRSVTLAMYMVRHGDEMIAIGLGVLILALTVALYARLVAKLGVPRLILILFFLFLCIASSLYGINVKSMVGNILKRTGMYGVLALAILPGIQCGIGLNLGMTIGCIAGLMATMLAIQFNITGWESFGFSVVVGILLAAPLGWAYAKLLNRLKGNEMTVSTYVGFSFVSLMCIAWMLLPFTNPKITWLLGRGLRVTHNLKYAYGSLLTNFLSFEIFGVRVPTGLLLFFGLCCFSMWLFTRSRTGSAMVAAGSNPRFAEASGINVDKMRTIGTVLSTVIASVGILVYSQSLGYAQLYNSPKQMGFIAASAILIGGASVAKAKVSHVLIGTFLFQGVLALGIQVANAAISGGGLSEVMRIMISNGIILYALTQSGGAQRE